MILDDIVAYKRVQVEKEKNTTGINALLKLTENRKIVDFNKALSGDVISIISEIKKASPSKGIIKEDFDHRKIAKVYEEIEIDALSVLTERGFFKGEDRFIADVKEISAKPVLRKDFIIDEFQIFQAKAIGADAILLIAALLNKALKRYYEIATQLGLHCLIEVHNREELEQALLSGGTIIGINNRDLKTFKEDLKTTESLIKYIPSDKIVVSESCIKTPEDVRYLSGLGVKAVLIGETFMRNIEDRQRLVDFVNKSKTVSKND